MAINYRELLIEVLGGLAIFIFGMKLMSEGLSLVAGDRLRALLNLLTRNRFAAVGVGLGVTGLIQSSSACTVMVIGFVNAGLMRLEQAIGVIMGSNIGTTVTAQMISFKLEALALPAVAAGVVLSLLARRNQMRFAAQILIGFGVLFLGMGMMADTLKSLKDSVTLQGLFAGLDCSPVDGRIPTLGVLRAVAAGTLLTMIVQSSSASIGLLLALAGAGLLNLHTSFAILLGDNIGTTITPALAAIGASRTAKRAACAHCLFNITGTIIMIVILHVPWPSTGHPNFMEFVSRSTGGDNFRGENLTRFLANAHTLFNTSCTVAFIGFISLFARACRLIVPGKDKESEGTELNLLEPHLIATPSIAIQQAWSQLGIMVEQSRLAHEESLTALVENARIDWSRISDSVRAHEQHTDRLQTQITEYLTEISMETLTEQQSAILPRLLHSVNDAERIGDHSMHMMRLARRMRKRSLPFCEAAQVECRDLMGTVQSLFDLCRRAVAATHGQTTTDSADAQSLRALLDEARRAAKTLRKQTDDFRKSQVARQEAGSDDIHSGVIFIDVLLNLNRVGGHLYNIIEASLPDPVTRGA